MGLSTAEAISILRTGKTTDHKQLAKAIRKVHDGFNYDLRRNLNRGQKAAITKAAEEFYRMGQKSATFYRPSKKRRKDLATLTKAGTNWKYQPLPLEKGDKIRYRKDGLVVISREFESELFLPFNALKLSTDTLGEITRVLNELDKRANVHAYFLGIGRYMFRGGRETAREFPNAELLAEKIQELMVQYGVDGARATRRDKSGRLNHEPEKWISGVYGITFRNQTTNTKKAARQKRRNRARKHDRRKRR